MIWIMEIDKENEGGYEGYMKAKRANAFICDRLFIKEQRTR
ncbi:hypothetical protein [Parabacteroides gordonii]|nr:hypothetical protein [Parabacteroides gordonii]